MQQILLFPFVKKTEIYKENGFKKDRKNQQKIFTSYVDCAILLWYEILAYARFQDTPSVT